MLLANRRIWENLVSSSLLLVSKAGDIVTFVLAHNGVTDAGGFHTEQFMLDPESEATLVDTIHASNGPADAQNPGRIRLEFTFGNYGDACIVSRNIDGQWKRTTSFMGQRPELIALMQTAERYNANVASFGNNAGEVNPPFTSMVMSWNLLSKINYLH